MLFHIFYTFNQIKIPNTVPTFLKFFNFAQNELCVVGIDQETN